MTALETWGSRVLRRKGLDGTILRRKYLRKAGHQAGLEEPVPGE